MKRRLRSALLSAYKMLIAATGVLPPRLRARIDSRITYVLLSVANAPPRELEARYSEAVRMVRDHLDDGRLGDYVEFGVSFGASLACMFRVAERHGLHGMRFFGFDSFEGLPDSAADDDAGYWSPRMFASDVEMTRRFLTRAGVDWNRVTLVKGWFNETLAVDPAAYGLHKASVVMIDCDTYLSTREALAFCRPIIQDEAVVMFDDWYSGRLDERNLGERRAFEEFLQAGGFTAEPVGRFAPNAQVFRVVRASFPSP